MSEFGVFVRKGRTPVRDRCQRYIERAFIDGHRDVIFRARRLAREDGFAAPLMTWTLAYAIVKDAEKDGR